MSAPKHDNVQSDLWREQVRRDLKGYEGPRKEELQRK